MNQATRGSLIKVIAVLCAVLPGPVGASAQAASANVPYGTDTPVEIRPLYFPDTIAPWFVRVEERRDGPASSASLWLNTDWKALPWAGVTFRHRSDESWQLTKEWLESGFVRFRVRAGADRYGAPAGSIELQVAPQGGEPGPAYVAIPSRCVNEGRGFDDYSDTWQEVLIPLRVWGLKVGTDMRGFMVQCVDRPMRSFGLADVAFVRFEKLPGWMLRAENADVSQPWVRWPEYAQLPEALKADRHPPQIRDGKFVTPDGRRTFVLNGWSVEDQRGDLWGRTDGPRPPNYGLYDPTQHGWIYDELPTRESLCRLGFNSFSVNILTQWTFSEIGGANGGWSGDPAVLPETVRRIGLPFYLDTLSVAYSPTNPAYPADAFTQGSHHWCPYRTIGTGRDVWLKLWQLTAQRFKNAGAHVLMYELMNEPSQVDVSAPHRRAFTDWLRKRYGSVEAMNAVWKTRFVSWDDAVAFEDEKQLQQTPGRRLDYDEYLAGRYCDLIADGVATVNSVLPDALVGVQPMSGFVLRPREAVWPHRIVARETVVIAPTTGGEWSAGARASHPSATVVEHPMAGAPLENDLLLVLAGTKMIFDNETYLREAQTALAVRNRLWRHVVAGMDGLTIFNMTKWGYNWWNGRAALQTSLDNDSFHNLNPLARRTEALRGIHDFAAEVQPLADRILPKPWGPKARIGLLYSWPQARRMWVEPDMRDKTAYYHAALRYAHWNAALVPSDRALAPGGLAGLDVLVAGGIRVAEQEMPACLEAFVRRGGILILGEEAMSEDLYGRPLDTPRRFGVTFGDWTGSKDSALRIPESPLANAITGKISAVRDARQMDLTQGTPIVSLADGTPVVLRRRLGRGLVYAIGADLAYYPLAKTLTAVLEDAARFRGRTTVPDSWRCVEVRTSEGDLCPNVLVSRRSYANRHAILLFNCDTYEKAVRLKVPGLKGKWRASEELGHAVLTPEAGWYGVTLKPGAPAVVLLEKPSGG